MIVIRPHAGSFDGYWYSMKGNSLKEAVTGSAFGAGRPDRQVERRCAVALLVRGLGKAAQPRILGADQVERVGSTPVMWSTKLW